MIVVIKGEKVLPSHTRRDWRRFLFRLDFMCKRGQVLNSLQFIVSGRPFYWLLFSLWRAVFQGATFYSFWSENVKKRVGESMPFKSKKQIKWMYANKPKMAKKWAKHTKNIKRLPTKVKKTRKKQGTKVRGLTSKGVSLIRIIKIFLCR